MKPTRSILCLIVISQILPALHALSQTPRPESGTKASALLLSSQSAAASALTAVAFSPDKSTLAVGGYKSVTLLNVLTGKTLAKLPGHAGAVSSLAFSPDGKFLAAAGGTPGKSGEILIWSAQEWQKGQPRRPQITLNAHSDVIYGLAYSPNGKWLAACSYDRLVSLLEIPALPKRTPTGEIIKVKGKPTARLWLKDHTDAVYAVAFSPDGKRVASAAGDRTVKVWNTKTGKRIYTLSESTAELYAVAFSPDGKRIAAGGVDKTLRVWNVTDSGGKLTKSAFAHDAAILKIVFSQDGRALVTSGEDRAIKRWQTVTLAEQKVYAPQPDWPQGIALSSDGKWLAVGRQNGSLAIYDAGTGKLLREPIKAQMASRDRQRETKANTVPTRSTIEGLKPGTKQKKKRAKGGPTLFQASLGNVAPVGVVRGKTERFTLSGGMIADATGVFFDDPNITGRIVTPADKNAGILRVDTAVGEKARIGIHRVWVQTPHGTTGSVTFAVGGWPETAQKEENDTPEAAQPIAFPTTVVGAMEKPGDADCYRFEAQAGRELVFEVIAQPIRSRLQPTLTLLDSDGKILSESKPSPGRTDGLLGYRFTKAGSYVLRLRDLQNASGGDTHYRLNAGEFPMVTRVFPAGLQRGVWTDIHVEGFNLGGESPTRMQAPKDAVRGQQIPLYVMPEVAQKTGLTEPLGGISLAVGEDPEILQEAHNATLSRAQPITVPVTVNGVLNMTAAASFGENRSANPSSSRVNARFFRFTAKKGQPLLVDVMARRRGSALDPEIEILDSKGNSIERAVLRAVGQTEITLNDRDSYSTGLRLIAWDDFHINDYLLVGREVIRILALPNGPDADLAFRSLRGRRLGFFGTTPEHHSVGERVYKVEIHPPGSKFSPNGYPLTRLTYRNDDGGPLHGKDSYLEFTPPANGEYILRLSDARGTEGENFTYRLSIRPPRPDFRVSMSPGHPNIPKAGGVTVNVECERYDGFAGAIEIGLEGLPPGFTATRTTIQPGETSAILLLSAAPDAATPPAAATSSLRLVAKAKIGSAEVTRTVEPDNGVRLLTVLPVPDLSVSTDRREVVIHPGEEVEVEATVIRNGEYGGRVPIGVENLPFGVRVLDVGLNGVLVTEEESSRKFTIQCDAWVKPQTRSFYVIANVEGGTANAALPLILRVEARAPVRAAKAK